MRPSMALGLVLVILAGCGSNEAVVFEEAFPLLLDGRKFNLTVGPAKQNVKHKIIATATAPINIYVYPAGDDEAVKKDLDGGHTTLRLIAYQENKENFDFEASLAPDSNSIVYFRRAAGPANVKLKITTKK